MAHAWESAAIRQALAQGVRCFEHAYEATWDGPVTHQPEEVAEGHWAPLAELAALLSGDRFVPDTAQLLGLLADRGVGDYSQLRLLPPGR